jgi:hypothetical protein
VLSFHSLYSSALWYQYKSTNTDAAASQYLYKSTNTDAADWYKHKSTNTDAAAAGAESARKEHDAKKKQNTPAKPPSAAKRRAAPLTQDELPGDAAKEAGGEGFGGGPRRGAGKLFFF